MEYNKFMEFISENGFTKDDAKQGGVSFLGSDRDLLAGIEEIKDNEKPLAIAGGQYFEVGGFRAGTDNAIFILTDRRILRANKKIKNTDFKTFYIQDINSSELKTSYLSSEIVVETTSSTVRMQKIKKDTAVRFNNLLIELIDAKKHSKGTTVNQTSGMDEIKKAKELLDAGIIDQKEFDAIKKKHIG